MARLRRITSEQGVLPFERDGKPKLTIAGFKPYYGTALGDAYLADALDVLKVIPDGSINAALICRDHLLGSLDDRSTRIVKALLDSRTKKDIAAAEGISPSAVSQRAGRDGLDLIVLATKYLRSVP